MYGLYLNMMRDRAERMDLIATSEDLNRLQDFVRGEQVEPYQDVSSSGFGDGNQTFYKAFRQGGPLEWYNPPSGLNLEDGNSFTGGIKKLPDRQEYMEQAGRDWDRFIGQTRRV